MKGEDNVNKSAGFTPATEGQVRVTRMAADPLNVRQQASRLDIRKQFYSHRVVDTWNKVPTDIKNIVTVSSFKMAYKNTEENWRQPRRESRFGGRMRWMSSLSQQQSLRGPSGTNETQPSTVNSHKVKYGIR